MAKEFISVAVDGPAGAGKSTIARRAAKELGFVYVDTGAIYRTVAFAALERGADTVDSVAIAALLPFLKVEMRWDADGAQHMLLSDRDVTALIRTPEVSAAASKVAAVPAVRDFLIDMQRNAALSNSVIMDGRDIGTVVLPDARVKIFLTASAEVRAKRRWLELREKQSADTYEQVLAEIRQRDERDSSRAVAPLKAASDAVLLDTSELTAEESVAALLEIVRQRACL